MIVRSQPNWLRMLFVWNGSVLPAILPQMAVMTAVSTLAVFTGGRVLGDKLPLNPSVFTLLGVALAIFLAFRNTASYERFQEGRRIWGALLIAARALVSQVQAYAGADAHPHATFDQRQFVARLTALVYALKHQLRHTSPQRDLDRLLPPQQALRLRHAHYLPVQLMHELRSMLAGAERIDALGAVQLWSCDAQLNKLNECIGACERIAATPIPFAYGVLLHRTVYIYCLLLPFGLVDAIGYATPLIAVFVSYTFVALEAIAGDIAEPFRDSPNGLALDAICREIERSLAELSGQEMPPTIVCGKDYRLS
jgi:putative membrane protein